MAECIHKDIETGWCKLLSDWSDAMPVIEYCVEGACPRFEPIGGARDVSDTSGSAK